MARGSDKPRALRKDRNGRSPFFVGALTLVVAAIVVYFGFTKAIPFKHGFRVQAVFQTSNSIRKNSPVRIAGVNVGKVKAIKRQPGTDAAIVTLELDKKGLPIHKDATAKIRPRIFLEGNFFVDLFPGTPSSPTLDDNDAIPMTQTSAPVQLDQVLGALSGDTRTQLKTALSQYGLALTQKPTAQQDADQDPSVRGKTAAEALNKSFDTGAPALRNLSIVNEATLGTEPHDLSKLVKDFGTVAAALDRNESQLQSLVSNFNTTVGAFASEQGNLKQTIARLPGTLQIANRTFASLNAAFPNTRAFAKDILPGVRETPATINAAFPWLAQANKLLGPTELRGLTKELRPTTADLSRVVDQTNLFLPQADLVAQCAYKVLLPAGDIKIDEGKLSTGVENYKEFWYTMVGLAGEGQNFDGNGMYVRFQPGGGDQTISTGKVGGAAGDTLFGNTSTKPIGTRPAYPGKRPPYVPDAACKDQKVPDLNTVTTGAPDGGGSTRAAASTLARAAARKADEKAGPSDPSTTSAASSSSSSSAGSGAKSSVTDSLLSALNPFRTGATK